MKIRCKDRISEKSFLRVRQDRVTPGWVAGRVGSRRQPGRVGKIMTRAISDLPHPQRRQGHKTNNNPFHIEAIVLLQELTIDRRFVVSCSSGLVRTLSVAIPVLYCTVYFYPSEIHAFIVVIQTYTTANFYDPVDTGYLQFTINLYAYEVVYNTPLHVNKFRTESHLITRLYGESNHLLI
jgi:hypothetical protein